MTDKRNVETSSTYTYKASKQQQLSQQMLRVANLTSRGVSIESTGSKDHLSASTSNNNNLNVPSSSVSFKNAQSQQ